MLGSVMGVVHRVRAGECLHSLAARHGIGRVETILNHPRNETLKRDRSHASVLLPGDDVFIPAPEPRSHSVATGQRHRFSTQTARITLRIQLHDEAGNARGNMRYKLVLDHDVIEGTTDGDGRLEALVPAHATHADLIYFPEIDGLHGVVHHPLAIGHLDPVEALSGVQGFLTNLGFYHGPIDGESNDETTLALERFQARHRLDVTGEVDDATRSKLRELGLKS